MIVAKPTNRPGVSTCQMFEVYSIRHPKLDERIGRTPQYVRDNMAVLTREFARTRAHLRQRAVDAQKDREAMEKYPVFRRP